MILLLFKIAATSFVLVIVVGIVGTSVFFDVPSNVESVLGYVARVLWIVFSLCIIAIILTLIWIL